MVQKSNTPNLIPKTPNTLNSLKKCVILAWTVAVIFQISVQNTIQLFNVEYDKRFKYNLNIKQTKLSVFFNNSLTKFRFHVINFIN